MNGLIICRMPAVSKQMSQDDESILIICFFSGYWLMCNNFSHENYDAINYQKSSLVQIHRELTTSFQHNGVFAKP